MGNKDLCWGIVGVYSCIGYVCPLRET